MKIGEFSRAIVFLLESDTAYKLVKIFSLVRSIIWNSLTGV